MRVFRVCSEWGGPGACVLMYTASHAVEDAELQFDFSFPC